MPTGYTAQITSTTTLRDFAMICARAFGATITMRDDPANAAIPEKFEADPYHTDRLKEIEAEIAEVQAMTSDQTDAAAKKNAERRAASERKRRAEQDATRENYTRVLREVEAWDAPAGLSNLKAYMGQQIKDSIAFDCPEESPVLAAAALESPVEESGAAWRARILGQLVKDRDYHTTAHREECERVAERNAWLAALRASLPTN